MTETTETPETTTILVIDDSPIDREIYARLLARSSIRDYVLLEAESGDEAIDLLAEEEVDCILLDFNLEGEDGLEVLDRLRAAWATEIPVVMLTGAGSEKIAVETMKRGCSDYILKGDANAERLPQAVENAIEKVTLRREIERKRADLEAAQREQLELKNRFLSHVSHELRTPLTAVHQFLSLCLDGLAGELTETQREYLEIAQRNTNQLKSMIGDLMELTRAQSGKLRVEVAPFALAPLVRELVETHTGAAESKGVLIEAEAEADDGLPNVLADETRVRQVLGNLIENALKFTPAEGSIRVSVGADPREEGHVRVSVRDTGCGISEAGQKKIFGRLHQEENLESAESRQGLGLGLAICKELVYLQGGRIWVESQEGVGSVFHFTLPVYTLARVITPALVREDGVRSSYVVLRVRIERDAAAGGPPIGEEQSRRIHQVLGKLVYYPYDVVLPRRWQADGPDDHFAIVATDAAGLKAVVPRVREQIASHVAAKLPKARLCVDGRLEELGEELVGGPMEEAIEVAAKRIEVLSSEPREWGD